VERAHATRRWPSTVRIVVVERRPVATVPTPDHRLALIDKTARVLEVVVTPPTHLPVLGNVAAPGPLGSRIPDADAHLAVAAALTTELRDRVTDIATVSGGGVDMAISASTVVRLGPAEDLPRKMASLLTVLARVDLKGVRLIDVRVPDAPVLTRS
jgi:cell division protein FtsQ